MTDQTIKEISLEFGTPLYLYDGENIESQYRRLKNSLPEHFEIFYSMKANPLLGICQLCKTFGSSIEVASVGELYIALQAGFSPENIIFTSPGKTIDDIEYALDNRIFCINVESIDEAITINTIAQKKGIRAPIAVRINPDFDASDANLKMTGVPTQFGIDQPQLPEFFETLKSLKQIELIGIHIYTGTQILKAESLVANMEEIIKLGLSLAQEYQFNLSFLDLGGGFGVPYFQGETDLDLELFEKLFKTIWDRYKNHLSKTRMCVESGRFLTAESGSFVTKVIYSKNSKGRTYLICDGGSNQHANSAFLGRHIRSNFPMRIIGRNEESIETFVAGPLCTPVDLIGQKISLPVGEVGDLLVVEKSGAYGLSNSPSAFLSHPLPAEILHFKDKAIVLRERGRKEDFLTGQRRLS